MELLAQGFELSEVERVDAFHAMIHPRTSRQPRTAALEELQRCAGTQFDGRVVGEFVRLIGEVAAAT